MERLDDEIGAVRPGLRSLEFKPRYSTSRDDLAQSFYGPALERALKYDRAVGYFRSSIVVLCREPIAHFAVRGGRIRVVCSPALTTDDFAAISRGYALRERVGEVLQREIELVLQDAAGRSALEFLATLVAVDAVDLRLAFRPSATGIFHDKVGILADSADALSFVGSANETAVAWDPRGNHESFEVFTSWSPDEGRVREHQRYFESLWLGNEPGVVTVSFPDTVREQLVSIANPGGVESAFEVYLRSSSFRRKTLQPHQLEALEAWESRGKTGIISHATSAGKTLTAIRAVERWIRSTGPALVIVPSELLLHQWHNEVRDDLAGLEPRLLLVGAGYDTWRQADVVEGFTAAEGPRRITIATMQTASSPEFRARVQSGAHLLLVADEAHRLGSSIYQGALFEAGGRLGLTATAERYGDPAGTQTIEEYFRGEVESPFTLADGIAAGRICTYRYYVHPVELNEEEAEKWKSLTAQVARRLAGLGVGAEPDFGADPGLEVLLFQRAGVVKQARAKVQVARNVIQREYAEGDRWIVYCDDRDQLDDVAQALRDAGIRTQKYYADMPGDREATLDYFGTLGGVVVAIRCLDEGVDIPSVDHALILASSRNQREFIQRRGRVLRTAPGKTHAVIHDALVVPPAGFAEPHQASLLGSEIARASRFAEDASNVGVRFRIRQIARDYGIRLDDETAHVGFEVLEVAKD